MDAFLRNCEAAFSRKFNQYGYDFKESDGPKHDHEKADGLTPLSASLIDEYELTLENELLNLEDLK